MPEQAIYLFSLLFCHFPTCDTGSTLTEKLERTEVCYLHVFFSVEGKGDCAGGTVGWLISCLGSCFVLGNSAIKSTLVHVLQPLWLCNPPLPSICLQFVLLFASETKTARVSRRFKAFCPKICSFNSLLQ